MVAIIGGQTHRFKNLIDLYYQAAEKAGHDRSELKVGIHSLGFVAKTKQLKNITLVIKNGLMKLVESEGGAR